MSTALNVLGTPLVPCSFDPLTGWYRDGCCHTDAQDLGSHVICAKVTVSFLNHQMEHGNDLITPRPEHRFRGLKPATAGAYAPCAGARPARTAVRRPWCWKARTRVRWSTCCWTGCASTP
jgi:uncharacterized protein (DUF2237 family)